MNLYQDAAGTIPAVLAGQPVGCAKRKSGTVDATQATALSKGTLARWPKSGRRNLMNLNTFEPVAVGRTSSYNAGGLQVVLTQSGISGEVIGKGVLNDIPYIDVKYFGTNSGGATAFFNLGCNTPIAVAEGERFVTSIYLAFLAGTYPTGLRTFQNFNPAPTQSNTGTPAVTGEFTKFSVTGAVGVGKNIAAGCGAYIGVAVGDSIDCTVRVGGVQFERGTIATPTQLAYGINDITEPNVPDLWHIYNDGGDSLNANLPAGTYGILSMDINRVIKTESVVLAEQGDINILRNERQLDSIIRTGAFSPAEQREIENYWMRKFQ